MVSYVKLSSIAAATPLLAACLPMVGWFYVRVCSSAGHLLACLFVGLIDGRVAEGRKRLAYFVLTSWP